MATTAAQPRTIGTGRRSRLHWPRIIHKTFVYALLVSISLFFFFPLLWMMTTAIKPTSQMFQIPPVWIPKPPQWDVFHTTWNRTNFSVYLGNTVLITVLSMIGRVGSCALVGFSFARLRWPGKNVLFLITLSTMMLPFQVLMIPQFLIFKEIGWINTHYPLWVPSFGGAAFYIFLMRQYFMTMPRELDDAAKIDGCGWLGIFWRILLPLSHPALATIAIFTFMSQWNSFLEPLIFLNSSKKYTLALGLAMFRDQFDVDWNAIMAMSFLMVLPCLTIFFLAQKYFIQGISTTGLKG
ncbi:MAG: carbohydrate ABC transporter permease [Caldilineaceae bacterium SB0664_bin_22]|nr:carbohydrate ABC transporter permease [Caldilineaceae bacterium SB0664_bin_22]